MELGNLDFKIGCVNPSGIGSTIFRIAKKHIKSWPTIEDDHEAEGKVADLSEYTGDFVLMDGKVFDKFYSTQGKGKLTFQPTGEIDCKMFTNSGTFSFPDLTSEALGFCKTAANDDYVYIAKSAGRYHVLGHQDYRTTTSPAGDTGDAAGSAKGITFTVECPDVTPLPIYKGKIVTSDGELDCATGEFTPKAG